MKKLLILLAITIIFTNDANAQTPCETVTTTAFPRNPQTGSNNYFGVQISIPEIFSQDITVSGYIYEDGSYNTNNPFTLTITAGNTSAETADNFFSTNPTGIALVEVTTVTPCPAVNFLADFSSDYVKRHVAVVDFYVRSISTSNFVREIYFKNYGSTALPSVLGFNNDLFFDDGTNNDQVSGDGIYTSTDSYAHTATVPYTNGVDVSVQQNYAIIDNIFEHEASFNSFLSTYSVPTGGGAIAAVYKSKISIAGITATNALINNFNQEEVAQLPSFSAIQNEMQYVSHYLNDELQNESYREDTKSNLFKFKASLKCDVAGCNCSTCHCRACNYRWGQSLNWCFTLSNCSIEIGWA